MRRPELRIKRARGFLLIVAILLLVVIALAIAAMANMTSADIRSSSGHAQSEQAYFAATSGIEYAKGLFLTGTPCAAAAPPAGLLTTANVGNGSFTISSVTPYNVSSSTVAAGGISAAATTIPVTAMGSYAPFGRITIDSEEMYYKGISGNNFLNVRRGSSNTVAAAHSAGAVLIQGVCNVTVAGAVGDAQRILSANMPLQNYKQGVLTKPAAAGAQSITGVGFRPTAVIFLWTKQTIAATVQPQASSGIGFAAGGNQYAVTVAAVDAQGTTRNGRMASAGNSIIFLNNNTGAPNRWPQLLALANLQSMDSDGFTLNWTTNLDANAYRVAYVAIGGDTNAYVGNFNMNNAAGNQAVTGTGFTPDMVMFIHAADGAVAASSSSDAQLGLGFAQGSVNHGAMVYSSQTGLNTANPGWQQLTSRAILFLNHTTGGAPTALGQADFVSMDANGFTINVTTAPGGANWNLGYLALRGARAAAGAFNQATSAGVQQAVNTLGFEPSGVLLASRNLVTGATVSNAGRSSIGVAGGNAIVNGNLWFEDQSAGTSNTNEWNDAVNVISMGTNINTPTNRAQASLQSLDLGGFTLNWSVADAVAREILYSAIGPRSFADVIELY